MRSVLKERLSLIELEDQKLRDLKIDGSEPLVCGELQETCISIV